MKRWGVLALVCLMVVLSLALAGCGSTDTSATVAEDTTLTTLAPTTTTRAPTTTTQSTTTTTTVAPTTTTSGLPTYSQVVSTYPAGAELIGTEADIMGGDDNGLQLGGSNMHISMRNGQMTYMYYGTKLTVKARVTLEGKTYEPRAKLTVDKDLHWIAVSSWD